MSFTIQPQLAASALAAAQAGLWQWLPDEGREFLDASLQQLLAAAAGKDGRGESLLDRLTAQDRARLLAATERAIATGDPLDLSVALPGPATGEGQLQLRGGRDPGDPRRLLVLCLWQAAPRTDRPTAGAGFPGADEYIARSCNGYFLADRTGRIAAANPAFCRLSGRTRDELLGASLPHLFAPHVQPLVVKALREMQVGACAEFELQVVGESAPPSWWFVTALCTEDGRIWGRATDITARKQAEESLRRERDQQGKLLDAAPVILLWLDLQGRIQHFNRYLAALLGRSIDELRGRDWIETFVPQRERAQIRELFQTAVETQRTRGNRNAILVAGGQERTIEWHDELLCDDAGAPTGLLAVGLDVTEAAQTETELQLKNVIVANMLAGALVVRMSDGLILYANRQFHELFGYADGELNQRHVTVLNGGDCTAAAEKTEEIRRSVRATGAWLGELLNRRKEGAEFWSRAHVVRFHHPQFGDLGISVQEDISQQKAQEAALRASERRLRQTIDACFGFIGLYDLDGTLIEANRAPLDAAGLSREEVIGRPFWETYWWSYSPDVQAELRDALHRAATGETVRYETPVRVQGGDLITIDVTFGPLRDDEGRIVGMVGFAVDISERKQVEAALRRNEARLRYLLQATPAVIYSLKAAADWPTTYISENIVGLTGFTGRAFLDDSQFWFSRLHPDDAAVAAQRMAELPLRGRTVLEYRFLHRDGKYRWLRDELELFRDAGGRPLEAVGCCFDITDRKTAEQALSDSEERLRLALANANQGLWDLNVATGKVVVSPEYALLLGCAPATFVETTAAWLARLHPDDRPATEAAFRAYAAGVATTYSVEFRQRTVGGDWKWILSSGKGVAWSSDGRPLRMIGTHTDITALKAVEAELRLKNEAVEAANAGIALADLQDRLTYVNAAFLRLWGYERSEEVIGRSPLEFWREPARAAAVVEALLKCGHWTGELTALRRDGSCFEVHLNASLLHDAHGLAYAMVATFIDVTARVQAEAALLASERQLRAIFEAEPECVKLVDREYRLLEINPAGLRCVEADDVESVRGCCTLDLIAPQDRATYRLSIDRAFAGERTHAEYEIIGLQGTRRRVEQHAVALPAGEAGQEETSVLAVTRDVTLRVHAETALRASEERLRILVENVPAGVAMLDRDLRYLAYSRRWSADYRLGDQDLHGRSHYEIFPEIPERWREIHRRCLAEGRAEHCAEDEFVRADGSVDYLRWDIQPWFLANGETGGLLFFTELTTARVAAERALRESEERLAEAQHLARLGSWNWDILSDSIQWSDEVFRIFGHAPQSFRPRYEVEFLHAVLPVDRAAVQAAVQATLADGAAYDVEHRICRPDGEERIVRELARVVRDAEGRPVRMYGTVQDVTESRRAETQMQALQAQLTHAARVAIVGEMGAGIAHELNQPLAALSLQVEECVHSLQHRELARRALIARLESVSRLALRCGRIIHRLRSFAAKQPSEPAIVDLHEIATSALSFLEHDLRARNLAWTMTRDEAPLRVLADAVQVQQVVINLVRNALDAQPAGGRIAVTVRSPRPGLATVEVRDFGPGLSAEEQARLFEPFFSTKAGGLGLGLKISRKIAEFYKGEIRCHSRPGQGATFTLLLPCHSDAVGPPGPDAD